MKLSFPKNSNQISLGPQAWRLKHRLCSEIAMNIDYCVQEKFSKINPKKNPQKKGKIPKNQFQQTFQVFLLGLNLKFENFQSGPWRFQTKKFQSEPPRKLSNKKISKKMLKKMTLSFGNFSLDKEKEEESCRKLNASLHLKAGPSNFFYLKTELVWKLFYLKSFFLEKFLFGNFF